MPTLTAAQCEQLVTRTLETVRSQFQRALDNTSEGGNVLVALDTEIHVDQVRRIAAGKSGAPKRWVLRDGKRTISTASETDRAMLSLYVGGNRFVTAELTFLILCDIVGAMPVRGGPNIPGFVNLVVVEPYLYPARELPIWLTIAQKLATGHDREDLHAALPELSTAFDILYQELPSMGEYADKLRPAVGRSTESWPAYQMHMLARACPNLAGVIAGLQTDEQRAQLFLAHEAELRAHVRAHVFARVAQAVSAADGSYAALHPLDDE